MYWHGVEHVVALLKKNPFERVLNESVLNKRCIKHVSQSNVNSKDNAYSMCRCKFYIKIDRHDFTSV